MSSSEWKGESFLTIGGNQVLSLGLLVSRSPAREGTGELQPLASPPLAAATGHSFTCRLGISQEPTRCQPSLQPSGPSWGQAASMGKDPHAEELPVWGGDEWARGSWGSCTPPRPQHRHLPSEHRGGLLPWKGLAHPSKAADPEGASWGLEDLVDAEGGRAAGGAARELLSTLTWASG